MKNITKLPEELLPERLMFMENNNEIKNNLVVVWLAVNKTNIVMFH